MPVTLDTLPASPHQPGRFRFSENERLQKVAEPVRLSGEIKEQGIFGSLISKSYNVTLFLPPKLPPLVLESKPIAVPDRMATKRSPASTAFAIGVHVVIILLIALFIASQVNVMAPG